MKFFLPAVHYTTGYWRLMALTMSCRLELLSSGNKKHRQRMIMIMMTQHSPEQVLPLCVLTPFGASDIPWNARRNYDSSGMGPGEDVIVQTREDTGPQYKTPVPSIRCSAKPIESSLLSLLKYREPILASSPVFVVDSPLRWHS